MRYGITILVAGWLLSGCLLNNINPSQKLNERVQEYSDATRWNRMDIAVQMVAAEYRDAFVKSHSAWGRAVEVADSELIHIQIAPDGNTATSTIAYSWYDLSAMTLARTVVKQQWNISGTYAVTGEVVVEGAPELLPAAAPPSEQADEPADRVASIR